MSPAGSASGFLTIRYSQIWQAANDNFAWMGSPGKKRGHHVDLDRRRPIGAALYADLVHGMLLIQLHKTMALRQTWKSAG